MASNTKTSGKDPKDISESSTDGLYQPLLSEEPIKEPDQTPARPLVSSEPVRVPGARIPVQDEYPALEYEPSDDDRDVAKVLFDSQPMHRVGSIEARMETHEHFNNLTRSQLRECMERVNELKDARMQMEDRIAYLEAGSIEKETHITQLEASSHEKELEMKERIAQLEAKVQEYLKDLAEKDKALAEAEPARQQAVREALEQAEKEKKELPVDVEVNEMLEEKLEQARKEIEILKEKLEKVKNETDEAKKDADEAQKKGSTYEQEKTKLQLDKSVLQLKGVILTGRIEQQAHKLKEQQENYQRLEKVVERLEERCGELEEQNEMLREGNTYNIIEDTVFEVIKVGSPATAATASEGATFGVMLECFSCHTLYYPSDNNEVNSCRFHPLPAMHYREMETMARSE